MANLEGLARALCLLASAKPGDGTNELTVNKTRARNRLAAGSRPGTSVTGPCVTA